MNCQTLCEHQHRSEGNCHYIFIIRKFAEKVKRFCDLDERQTAAEIKTRTEQVDPCNHYPAERVALSGSLSLYPKPGILSIEIRKKQEFPDFGERTTMKKKKRSRPIKNMDEMRKLNTKEAKGHLHYVCGKIGNDFQSIGITHGKRTKGVNNIPLKKNPNPQDSKQAFV